MSLANINILVVDDDEDVRLSIQQLLSSRGFNITESDSVSSALDKIAKSKIDLVLLDMNFSRDTTSGLEGLFFLQQLKEIDSDCSVIAMTAWSNVEIAVKAIKLGATDFIEKPFDNDELLELVRQTLSYKEKKLQAVQDFSGEDWPQIITCSPAMKAMLTQVELVAPTKANILLSGENGTGKSTIARWFHNRSKVASNPFVSVNMGAIPETLFESELFGHVKGAFTDAKIDRVGRFEHAALGTLFMDEIGNLPLHLQAKLLRVLESKEYEKLGSSETCKVNARLISASNANLVDMIKHGFFRSDLYYRLNTFSIHVPSLRERKEDIVPLAESFLIQHCVAYQRENLVLNSSAISALQNYSFPGNVRELSHIMERITLFCIDQVVKSYDIESAINNGHFSAPGTKSDTHHLDNDLNIHTLSEMEKNLIIDAIKLHGGHVIKAAAHLNMSKSVMYRKLKKYNISAKDHALD